MGALLSKKAWVQVCKCQSWVQQLDLSFQQARVMTAACQSWWGLQSVEFTDSSVGRLWVGADGGGYLAGRPAPEIWFAGPSQATALRFCA